MKKYKRRLSIILTLVMIFTSIGFTGAFANEDEATDAADQNVQAVEQTSPEAPAADDAVVEEPAAGGQDVEADGSGEIPADESAATDTAPGGTVVPGESSEQVAPGDSVEPSDSSAENGQEGETAEKVKITWKVGKTDKTSEAAIGDVPVYPDGTPVPEGYADTYDETNYKFTGWTDGTNTYGPEEELPAVTADIIYTAEFKSLTVRPAKPKLKKNNDGKAYASYKSVWIEWEPVTKDENGYVYDESVTVNYVVRPTNNKLIKYDGPKTSYHSNKTTTKALKKVALDSFKDYTFYVSAYVKDAAGKKVSTDEQKIKGSPFKTIRYRLQIKSGSTLKKHAGYGPKSYNLKGGATIDTDRFQTGKYIFEYKGSVFYISQTRVGSAKALYNKQGSWNYTKKEAEHYIKDRKMTSLTNNLVFVNTFCQHVYFFERANKKAAWKCSDEWECGTGLASTPTPTGDYGEKKIQNRLPKKNNIKYWNMFNGNAALHGTKPRDKRVGLVISNGCVRNPVTKAKKIYTRTKLKTKVLIV